MVKFRKFEVILVPVTKKKKSTKFLNMDHSDRHYITFSSDFATNEICIDIFHGKFIQYSPVDKF